MQLSRALLRPITDGLAEGACPLLERLPRRSLPPSLLQHSNSTDWYFGGLLRNHAPRFRPAPLALGSPLNIITLLSPLSTLSSSVLFRRSRSSSAQPGVFLSIDHDTPTAIDLTVFDTLLLACIFIHDQQSLLRRRWSFVPVGARSPWTTAAQLLLASPHDRIRPSTTPECLSSMAKNGLARPASKVTE